MNKNTKNSKTEEKVEKQIEKLEKTAEVLDEEIKKEKERQKRLKKEKREEKKFQKKLKEKIEEIEKDLKDQLDSQGKYGAHFEDLVKDYLKFVELKENLRRDIELNGIRYECKTGNGYTTTKPNESVERIIKVNAQMLKILQDLELKEPDTGGDNPEDDLL